VSGTTGGRVTLIRRALRYRRRLSLVAPALAVCAGLWLAAPTAGFGSLRRAAASDPPVAAWTELGPGGAQSVRAVIASGACPELRWVAAARLGDKAMTVRARPTSDGAFTDTVCEAPLPDGATRADVGGVAVPVRRAALERVVVLGDTGCKITKTKQQACDDPAKWPFAKIATKIAAEHPDLILHVGDLLYRKARCTTNGCDNSPFDFTSAALQADFFKPAAPLLSAAPLVMTRGNHENCDADWIGWFRYFAFGDVPAKCQRFTAPFAVRLTADRQLVLMDTSASKVRPTPELTAEYTCELLAVNRLATVPTLLVSHVPFWEIASNEDKEEGEGGPATLEAALRHLRQPLSSNVTMIVSGDLHQFEYLSFDQTRPSQLILGDGGTQMSKAVKGDFKGRVVDDDAVSEGRAESWFGFGVIALGQAEQTRVAVKTADAKTWLSCTLGASHLHCLGRSPVPASSLRRP
jgi:hypothetical protein